MAEATIIPIILVNTSAAGLGPLPCQPAPMEAQPPEGGASPLQIAATLFASAPIVVCAAEHGRMVTEQLARVGVTPRAVLPDSGGHESRQEAAPCPDEPANWPAGACTQRPWGRFHSIDRGERFQVKHIEVDPGAKLSLQKHWHRSEHWVVVAGTALVTNGDSTFILRENQATFIPAATIHRLENPGKVPLRLIEVQSGEYVGEDDIVRLEDSYGR